MAVHRYAPIAADLRPRRPAKLAFPTNRKRPLVVETLFVVAVGLVALPVVVASLAVHPKSRARSRRLLVQKLEDMT